MQSIARDVTAYIDQAPAERREALNRLPDLCREVLLDFEVVEGILRGTMTSTGQVC